MVCLTVKYSCFEPLPVSERILSYSKLSKRLITKETMAFDNIMMQTDWNAVVRELFLHLIIP